MIQNIVYFLYTLFRVYTLIKKSIFTVLTLGIVDIS